MSPVLALQTLAVKGESPWASVTFLFFFFFLPRVESCPLSQAETQRSFLN